MLVFNLCSVPVYFPLDTFSISQVAQFSVTEGLGSGDNYC